MQRLGLAQALINDPEFLILDEPMSGLDPLGRKEVRDLLLSLRNKGKTLLFSSHILADAELICDRVAILVKGRVQIIGRLQEMMKKIDGYEVTLRNAGEVSLDGIRHEVIARADSQYLVKVPSIAEIDAIPKGWFQLILTDRWKQPTTVLHRINRLSQVLHDQRIVLKILLRLAHQALESEQPRAFFFALGEILFVAIDPVIDVRRVG